LIDIKINHLNAKLKLWYMTHVTMQSLLLTLEYYFS